MPGSGAGAGWPVSLAPSGSNGSVAVIWPARFAARMKSGPNTLRFKAGARPHQGPSAGTYLAIPSPWPQSDTPPWPEPRRAVAT